MSAPIPAARLASFYLTYYAALGAFTPYWSLYLQGRGQDARAIGVLMSLWYGTRIVAPSAWSWLAAQTTRPVIWLRAGCVLTLLSFLLFLLPLDFRGLFLAMCLFCFFYNAVMPQFEALTLSHLVGASERYGAIRVWGSVGFVVVVGLLGLVFDHLSIATLPLLMLPLFGALVVASLRNDYHAAPAEPAAQHGGFWDRLRDREVVVFLLVALLMQISFGPFYTFFSVYLGEHGYRPSTVGVYWAIGVGLEIAVFFFGASLLARWNARRLVFAALLCAAARWAVTALFPGVPWIMTIAQLSHALTFAGYFAASMHLLAEYFPGRLGGHGQGVFYGFSSGIGGVIGALVSGLVWQRYGGEGAFLFGAAAALVAALMWYPQTRR